VSVQNGGDESAHAPATYHTVVRLKLRRIAALVAIGVAGLVLALALGGCGGGYGGGGGSSQTGTTQTGGGY